MRSEPQITGSFIADIIRRESCKGCLPVVNPLPVALEPPYVEPSAWLNKANEPTPEFELSDQKPHRFIIWPTPNHELDWVLAERFIKILSGAKQRIGFEIIGNASQISFGFLAYTEDAGLLSSALRGEYEKTEISVARRNELAFNTCYFKDFLPFPPYHHLLTQPEAFESSPYETYIRYISKLPESITGFVQVLFEPAQHDWHRNVEILTDLEYREKSVNESVRKFSRQQMLPSSYIREMSENVTLKAHTDKPFFFASVRIGIMSNNDYYPHDELSGYINMFYHGGKPLQWIESDDYLTQIDQSALSEMIRQGITYHPGFLVNSAELAGVVHLPTMIQYAIDDLPIDFTETIIPSPKSPCLGGGLHIGSYWHGDIRHDVYNTAEMRLKGTEMPGLSGEGKTSLMKYTMFQDINNGNGLAFIDPHGDCVEEILELIPEERIHDTIYLDFGHPDWIPLFNPFLAFEGQDLSKTANNLITAIKSFIADTGWGDRLENILRFGFHAMLSLPGMTFLDLYKLLHPGKNSSAKNQLLSLLKMTITEETAYEFWNYEFDTYRPDDLASSKNKITKLIFAGPVAAMLSQPDNRISFREIMDTKKIFLVNLANLENEHRSIIGVFLLTFFHEAALARKEHPRPPFYLYCDEAHKLVAGNIENMLAEMRKFNVGMTLAHQHMSQFTREQQDALNGTGTAIIFRCNSNDAEFLSRQLIEKAEPLDIMRLKKRQAIARIDNQVVRITTPDQPIPHKKNYKDLIINLSRQRYCRMRSELTNSSFAPDDFPYDTDAECILYKHIPSEHQYEEFS